MTNKHTIIEDLYVEARGMCLAPGVLARYARKYGVSRERIRQVAKEAGFSMPRSPDARKVWMSKCVVCGEIKTNPKTYTCGSQECRSVYFRKKHIEKPCSWCGTPVIRKPSYMKRVNCVFCNRTCLGKYAGKHWGFGQIS